MLASNLNRLFLHTKEYWNPQIKYFANSFFFLLQALVVFIHVLQIFIVLTFFFLFSSAFFMGISVFFFFFFFFFYLAEKTKSPEHPKQFQKFFLLPVLRFSAMLRVVKMDKGATDICCW